MAFLTAASIYPASWSKEESTAKNPDTACLPAMAEAAASFSCWVMFFILALTSMSMSIQSRRLPFSSVTEIPICLICSAPPPRSPLAMSSFICSAVMPIWSMAFCPALAGSIMRRNMLRSAVPAMLP